MRRAVRYILTLFMVLMLNAVALAEDTAPSYPVNGNNGQPVQIQKPLKIFVNQNEFPLRFLAFLDTGQNPMVALTDCRLLFDLDMQIDDRKQVIISKTGKELVLTPEQYILFSSASLVSFPGIPASRLELIYLPLGEIASTWDVKWECDTDNGIIKLILPVQDNPGSGGDSQPALPANLPVWGDLNVIPAWASLWPGEEIIGGDFTPRRGRIWRQSSQNSAAAVMAPAFVLR